jgi:hypothetical protein
MGPTVRVSEIASKGSSCTPKPVDLLKPSCDLVPTGRHEGRQYFYAVSIRAFEQASAISVKRVFNADALRAGLDVEAHRTFDGNAGEQAVEAVGPVKL